VVCKEAQLPNLIGQDVRIKISCRDAGIIDKSGLPKEHSTVAISIESPSALSEEPVGKFAIQNCLEILNRVISSYQATTQEVDNAGFIFPLGTSYIQLFAEIKVNGESIRDRWPLYSVNTFLLPSDQAGEFER